MNHIFPRSNVLSALIEVNDPTLRHAERMTPSDAYPSCEKTSGVEELVAVGEAIPPGSVASTSPDS